MNVRNGIDHINQIFPSQSTSVSGAPQATSKQTEEPLLSDQTKLSATANHAAISATESDVRLEKVASIQRALQSGTYQVPATEVAEKLIASLLSSDS